MRDFVREMMDTWATNGDQSAYDLGVYLLEQIEVELSRDSPDQTNFPGYSSFWDTVKYNPAFQGRQMRPNSLKFPVFI